MHKVRLGAAIAVVSATAAALTFQSPVSAATLGTRYVSTTGTDVGQCASVATACATVNYAIGQANPGDTIKVAGGTYHQTINVSKPVLLRGAGATGANPTVIDGAGLDPSAYGVLHVGNTGGSTSVSEFTFTNPYPFTYTGGEPEAIALSDPNPGDTVTISNNRIIEGNNDPNAGTDFPIGIDSFNNAATTLISLNTIDGFFQGALLEDNGPATVRNNTFQNSIPNTFGDTVYPAEGLFFLSDLAGDLPSQNAVNNTFTNYSGYGVAADAGYKNGNCTDNPCDGSISGEITANKFALVGGSSGAAAIALSSLNPGNTLTYTVSRNRGYTTAPNTAIAIDSSGGGTISVTQSNNHIAVRSGANNNVVGRTAARTASGHSVRMGGLHVSSVPISSRRGRCAGQPIGAPPGRGDSPRSPD